jgi:ferrous iron transport protein B
MIKSAVLTGNPNCGKTTIFNTLTGSSQYVGNWPGVTVEKKVGKLRRKNFNIDIVDLPGIYSINPYSMEEKVAEEYIRTGESDIIINVIDATSIERSMFLTLQLIETGKPVVAVLNMMDVIEKEGTVIDVVGLEKELGIRIIPVSAKKNKGMDELVSGLEAKGEMSISTEFEKYLNETNKMKEDDVSDDKVSSHRYKYIKKLVGNHLVRGSNRSKTSRKIDNILTHKYLGIPIFLTIMWLIYNLAINTVGAYSQGIVEYILSIISINVDNFLVSSGANEYIRSLIVEGVLSGVGSVLLFLPQIMVLFFFIALLEDSGYMSRVSFILDKVFRRIGLTGKSFIPMFVGSGCSVPGIMAARMLDSDRERKMTIILTPFISCGAKMPLYIMFAAAFFPENTHWIIMGMYGIGALTVILSGLFFRKFIFKGHNEIFILELPDYRAPVVKNVMRQVWTRSKAFITKAGTIIFAGSVVIWFLQNFTLGFQLTDNPGESFLGIIGTFVAPVFRPIGFSDWKTSVAFLTGFIAKEMVVATLAVLNGVSESGGFALLDAIRSSFTPLAAFSFMIFIALSAPCIGAIAATKRELNSWKWTGFAILYQTGVAYIMALIVYNVGKLIWG